MIDMRDEWRIAMRERSEAPGTWLLLLYQQHRDGRWIEVQSTVHGSKVDAAVTASQMRRYFGCDVDVWPLTV